MLQKQLKDLHGSVIDSFVQSRAVSFDIDPFVCVCVCALRPQHGWKVALALPGSKGTQSL